MREPGLCSLRPPEPLVEASVGGSPIKFLVDTGEEASVFKNSHGAIYK